VKWFLVILWFDKKNKLGNFSFQLVITNKPVMSELFNQFIFDFKHSKCYHIVYLNYAG